jgi:prefoldin subunit 5
LTGLAALATAANVLAPFLAPSIEAKRLNEAMTRANTSIDKLKSESQFMKQQIQQLKQALSLSRQKPANSPIRAANKN